jgi:hypothetical protein
LGRLGQPSLLEHAENRARRETAPRACPSPDPEAETLIRQTTTDQPDAAYRLVQTVLIQDLSLSIAQDRIAELEKSLAETKMVPFLPGGFLGGLSTPNEPVPKAAARPT